MCLHLLSVSKFLLFKVAAVVSLLAAEFSGWSEMHYRPSWSPVDCVWNELVDSVW